MNIVITAHSLIEKPSSKALMVQVSDEISLGPPSGRPGYNLDDYIKEGDPYEEGDQEFQGREREREKKKVVALSHKNKCKPSPRTKTEEHY